jgi:GGDEF domain-containing protein
MLSLKTLIEHTGAHPWNGGTVASILLDGFCLYTTHNNAAGFEAFESEIRRLKRSFEQASGQESALTLTRESISCLEHYGAAVEQALNAQREQTRQAVELLTESLVRISHGSAQSAENLRAVGGQLRNAVGLDDLAAINKSLKSCLSTICIEADRQFEQHTAINHDLAHAGSLCRGFPASEIDAVTGLLGAADAATAIRALATAGKLAYVTAFAVERLETINLRFGFKVGDQILLLFAQHMAQHISDGDALFRWRGPCFVVITERPASELTMIGEATKMSHARLEHVVSISSREINVPIASSWALLRIQPTSDAGEAISKLDEFAIHRAHSAGGSVM